MLTHKITNSAWKQYMLETLLLHPLKNHSESFHCATGQGSFVKLAYVIAYG